MYSFGSKSLEKMKGLHPDLIKVLNRAIHTTTIDFAVIDGVRTIEQQKKYFATGKSKTMRSRHLTGHAFDIAPVVDGKITWDWAAYSKLAPIVKKAAADVGVKIEWGGDWATFKDGPHWQLPWKDYP